MGLDRLTEDSNLINGMSANNCCTMCRLSCNGDSSMPGSSIPEPRGQLSTNTDTASPVGCTASAVSSHTPSPVATKIGAGSACG